MSDFLACLEADLVQAARRESRASRRRAWTGWRPLLLSTALFVSVGAATAGGTLLVLRGSVIPAPAVRDVPRDQLPVAGTAELAAVRAADPRADRLPWALRISRSATGLVCSTVGQRSGERFGLVGLDGRFRALPERIVDGCGESRRNAASLIGVRVFDAERNEEVRSVVYGVAGEQLRAVSVASGGTRREVPVGEGGTFLLALAGYPEDIGVTVGLAFEDGHRERHPFGRSPFVVADPLGGSAWKASVSGFGVRPGEPPDLRTCVNFQHTRDRKTRPTFSPPACGHIQDASGDRSGYFFAVRRLERGSGGLPAMERGNWGDDPPRTAVWGAVGDDVEKVEVLQPGRPALEVALTPGRAVLAVLAPEIDPETLEVRVSFKDGRVETRRGDSNLVRPPWVR